MFDHGRDIGLHRMDAAQEPLEKGPAQHARDLEGKLLVGMQAVDALGDDALDGVRHRDCFDVYAWGELALAFVDDQVSPSRKA